MPRNLNPLRSIDDYMYDGPKEATKVRLRVPRDKERGIEPDSMTWPVTDGTIDAETTDAMLEWHRLNTNGIRTVRLEWLGGDGNYIPGEHNASINGYGVIDAQAEDVKPARPAIPTEHETSATSTRDLLAIATAQVRDTNAHLVNVTGKLLESLNHQSRAVVQLGQDNSARAADLVTLLIGETLAAKDDARASAVQRATDAKPSEAEGDVVKLAREVKDVFKTSAESGLSKFLDSLVKGDKPSLDTLRKQLARFSDDDKLKIVTMLTQTPE